MAGPAKKKPSTVLTPVSKPTSTSNSRLATLQRPLGLGLGNGPIPDDEHLFDDACKIEGDAREDVQELEAKKVKDRFTQRFEKLVMVKVVVEHDNLWKSVTIRFVTGFSEEQKHLANNVVDALHCIAQHNSMSISNISLMWFILN